MIRIIGLGLAGRRDESRRALLDMRQVRRISAFQSWTDFLLAWLDRRPADMRVSRAALGTLKVMEDPEAIFREAWLYCDVGEFEGGLGLLRRAVAKCYFVVPTLSGSRAFDPLRNDPAFQELLEESRAGRELALAAFRDGGGERLLGR